MTKKDARVLVGHAERTVVSTIRHSQRTKKQRCWAAVRQSPTGSHHRCIDLITGRVDLSTPKPKYFVETVLPALCRRGETGPYGKKKTLEYQQDMRNACMLRPFGTINACGEKETFHGISIMPFMLSTRTPTTVLRQLAFQYFSFFRVSLRVDYHWYAIADAKQSNAT